MFSAFSYLSAHPDLVKNSAHLGIRSISASCSALAVIALLSPGLTLVKEWTYAGLSFTRIGAFVSHTVARDGEIMLPVALLALLAIS